MNGWLLAAAGLWLALLPCAARCLRGDEINRLIALEMAGAVITLMLVVLAEGLHQSAFLDLALAMALLVFGGGLVFARALEKWL